MQILVVDKAEGVLTVPGVRQENKDSLLTRLEMVEERPASSELLPHSAGLSRCHMRPPARQGHVGGPRVRKAQRESSETVLALVVAFSPLPSSTSCGGRLSWVVLLSKLC